MNSEEWYNAITARIIKCAIEVHKELGPGLLESIYEVCFKKLLRREGLKADCQVMLPVNFQGEMLDKVFFIDILVENEIVVELKAVDTVLPIHETQLVSYLKLSGKKLGLLINFNVVLLKEG